MNEQAIVFASPFDLLCLLCIVFYFLSFPSAFCLFCFDFVLGAFVQAILLCFIYCSALSS